jgi:hypothetical protein
MLDLDVGEAEAQVVSRRLEQALLSAGEEIGEVEKIAGVVDGLADELGKTPAEISAQLAEARRLASIYEEFRARLDTPGATGDPRRNAADELRALERKRERLEAELRVWKPGHDERRRERVRAEVERLDQAEDELWPILHPAAHGSPFSTTAATESHLPHCKDCGAGISRQAAYTLGSCSQCIDEYELTTGRSWPTIP